MTTTINHINLSTTDPNSVALFFEKILGFRRTGERGGENFIILQSSDGFVLTLMADRRSGSFQYPKNFHIGVLQPDRASVLHIFESARGLGFLCEEPRLLRKNTFGFYHALADGIEVEVSTFMN